jgi:hypothetical protein
MTKTVEVMENEAQEFVDYAAQRGFIVNQPFIDSVIAELQAVGLWRDAISLKTYKMGLSAAIDSGKIVAPAPRPAAVDIAAAAERLRSAFPKVMTERELAKQKRDAAANAGIAPQTGRRTAAERKATTQQVDDVYAKAKNNARLSKLRQEYNDLKSNAETLRGPNARSHAQAYAARKAEIDRINSDPRFAEVRSE